MTIVIVITDTFHTAEEYTEDELQHKITLVYHSIERKKILISRQAGMKWIILNP